MIFVVVYEEAGGDFSLHNLCCDAAMVGGFLIKILDNWFMLTYIEGKFKQ